MNKVKVVVEGPTELGFVKSVLGLYFGQRQIQVSPVDHGGVGRYSDFRREVLAVLKQDADHFCTMMFDYYGMPNSWPGREIARQKPFAQKSVVIEEAIFNDIAVELGERFNRRRFIPYVQMHEFEALLFTDPGKLAAGLGLANEGKIHAIREGVQSPEEINDSEQTAPSKRIKGLYARYSKVVDGVLIAQKIGLEAMRTQCPHFNEWIGRLESLVSHPQAGA
jgi:hypothetical protein